MYIKHSRELVTCKISTFEARERETRWHRAHAHVQRSYLRSSCKRYVYARARIITLITSSLILFVNIECRLIGTVNLTRTHFLHHQ